MDGVTIRLDPSLAEALAWRTLTRLEASGRATPVAEHHRRAGPLYELGDPVEREAAFRWLAEREVVELRVLEPIQAAFAERAELTERIELLLIGEATGRTQEGATCDRSGRRIGVRALLHRFDDPVRLHGWARHVLGHAVDTLDPGFAYEPGWDEGAIVAGLAERLHLLWDISIDGRAAGDGRATPGVSRQRHTAALAALLPTAAPDGVASIIERLWGGPRPSFPELRAWSVEPERLSPLATTPLPSGRCPLCSFPSHDLTVPEPEVAADVAREYPGWRAGLGLCSRCLDRYAFVRIGGLS